MEEKKKSGFGAYKNLILFAVMMVAAVIVAAVKPSLKSYTGTAQGIESTVSVTIQVDGAGAIANVIIDVSGETPGLGADIGDAMVAQILEAQSDEIDAVSGCTITSNAVKTALRDAMTQAGMEIHEDAPEETPAGGEGTDPALSAGSYTAGTYSASATGMAEVKVNVTLDESGRITALEIDASGETESLGQVAAPKLQDKILEAGTIEGIDAISGCTVTSNAIFKAITDCMSQAAGGAAGGDVTYAAGTYSASATGMAEVKVNVTLDESGRITALEIDASGETESLGQVAAPKLQDKILEAGTIEGIDAISGCTVTSNAIFKAITDCMGQAAQ